MSGEGARGGHNFLSLFYVSTNFKRIFFEKNRRTLFGSLKCRQTLFNAQILFYKDFYDFTHESPVVNAFPSFAMDLREANWRPTYLSLTLWIVFRYAKNNGEHILRYDILANCKVHVQNALVIIRDASGVKLLRKKRLTS